MAKSMRRKTMKKSRSSRRIKGGFLGFGEAKVAPAPAPTALPVAPAPTALPIAPAPKEPKAELSIFQKLGLAGGKRKNRTNKRKNRKH